jgi:hypothetical protein
MTGEKIAVTTTSFDLPLNVFFIYQIICYCFSKNNSRIYVVHSTFRNLQNYFFRKPFSFFMKFGFEYLIVYIYDIILMFVFK